jgi:hypothetical protein
MLSDKEEYMRLKSICAFTLAALVTTLAACAADVYPVRPIRVLAAVRRAGPIDIMARVVGQKLSDSLGQSLVIDNRGGAGGTIATRIAAQSVPMVTRSLQQQSVCGRGQPLQEPRLRSFQGFRADHQCRRKSQYDIRASIGHRE